MPIISARYWNGVHDLEGMQDMRFLARNMAYFLKCREAADKAGIPLPKQEPSQTSFARAVLNSRQASAISQGIEEALLFCVSGLPKVSGPQIKKKPRSRMCSTGLS